MEDDPFGKGGGWHRYKTLEAVVATGSLSTATVLRARGHSYLLYLETTVSDYGDHKSDVKRYEPVRMD